ILYRSVIMPASSSFSLTVLDNVVISLTNLWSASNLRLDRFHFSSAVSYLFFNTDYLFSIVLTSIVDFPVNDFSNSATCSVKVYNFCLNASIVCDKCSLSCSVIFAASFVTSSLNSASDYSLLYATLLSFSFFFFSFSFSYFTHFIVSSYFILSFYH